MESSGIVSHVERGQEHEGRPDDRNDQHQSRCVERRVQRQRRVLLRRPTDAETGQQTLLRLCTGQIDSGRTAFDLRITSHIHTTLSLPVCLSVNTRDNSESCEKIAIIFRGSISTSNSAMK